MTIGFSPLDDLADLVSGAVGGAVSDATADVNRAAAGAGAAAGAAASAQLARTIAQGKSAIHGEIDHAFQLAMVGLGAVALTVLVGAAVWKVSHGG